MTVASNPASARPVSTNSDDWGDFIAAADDLTSAPLSSPKPTNSSPHSPRIHSESHRELPDTRSHQNADTEGVQNVTVDSQIPVASSTPLRGFDTLDDVQRYALGALAVVLLNAHATDMNGAAFARTEASYILSALSLRSGQQTALLALEPEQPTDRDAVVDQCVELVGDSDSRFAAIQAMLALAVARGHYDARSRAFLATVAYVFRIPWRAFAAVELAVAIQVFDQASADTDLSEMDDTTNSTQLSKPSTPADSTQSATAPKSVGALLVERRKKKMRIQKAVKISGITLVGGMLFGVTGGLIAPALLSALAGVGVASAAGLAASGTIASSAVVGGLFGVAGAGFTVKKAKNRVSTTLDEFDFERADDPRVIESRERKAERERRKFEKMVAARLAEEAEANKTLAIEDANPPPSADTKSDGLPAIDTEKELPRPPPPEEDDFNDEDFESSKEKKSKKSKKKKKREKLKVGPRALESTGLIPSLHVCICVPAWLTERSFGAALDQFEPALKEELPCSQHIALRWESRRLYEMGLAFAKFWASKATVTTLQQTYPHAVAAASTVAGAVAFAFAMPLTIMSCMDYVDNPWSILVSRSNGAGDELAEVLVERSYGQRPVSLFGYSIGSRVIFRCLEALLSRGALGIVDNVFLMGAAVTADPERWKKVRPVVAGRIVNAYGSYDWALAFFHRGCGNGIYVSGLRRVEAEGVENLNMGYLGIEGHRELKECVPRVMKAMGVGAGYIVMPPAKLVRRKRGSILNRGRSTSPVCEEPARLEETKDGTSEPREESPGRNENGKDSHLANMKSDQFWESNSIPENNGETAMYGNSSAISPSTVSSSTVSSVSTDLKHGFNAGGPSGSTEIEKKKKSKSWLSWSKWASTVSSSSSSKHKLKSQDRTGHDSEPSNRPVEDNDVSYLRTQPNINSSLEQNHAVVAVTAEGHSIWSDSEDEKEVSTAGKDENDDATNGTFDWELQRRIWEEQERQIQERGYADADIEVGNKVVLPISIEVAGRRLERFIDQDAELPVARKEQIFTNCAEDQKGVVVRVYEHEERTKSVPLNMLRQEEVYPKLLGEVDLRLKEAAVKGKLRVRIALWATEGGDICVKVDEMFADGSIGDVQEARYDRAGLCTMAERRQMEIAEQKRIQALVEEELRNRAQKEVLALPPAESKEEEGDDKVPIIDSEEIDNVRS